MYELCKARYNRDAKYIMLRISRQEAHTLIQSLNRQLQSDDPNSGRAEEMYRTSDGKEGGFFSISVQDPMVCAACGAEVKPYTGKKILESLICEKCTPVLEKQIKKLRFSR